jgi:plastocyanin
MRILIISFASLLFAVNVFALEIKDHNSMLMDHGGGHLMDMGGGMVMGQNLDTLPGGCSKIAATKEITVHAGHKYAKPFPGRMFAFDVQEYQFEPCTKLTINFINEDNIRHQWMMHGLPRYLYPKGMFHLEVTGPGKVSGTLILPPGDKTYLVHCDLAQHMEKGMKGQLKVGKGSGDLPSIPGVTEYVIQDNYDNSIPESLTATDIVASAPAVNKPVENGSLISGVMVVGLAIGLLVAPLLARKFKGMTPSEITTYIINLVKEIMGTLIKLINDLVKKVSSSKT